MSPWRQPWRLVTSTITILALGFVGWTVLRLLDHHQIAHLRQPAMLVSVAAAACGYALALALVAAGWVALVRGGARDVQLMWRDAMALYASSQIYKYLPSNMLHLVGRHTGLRRRGVDHMAAMMASVGEAGLLLVAAVLVAGLTGYLALAAMAPRLGMILLLLVAGMGTTFIGLRLARSLLARWPSLAALTQVMASPRIRGAALWALAAYIFFFLLSGLVFAALVQGMTPLAAGKATLLVSIWASAWCLGFVTPGAPAGLGVREALLIGGLSAAGIEGQALQAALAMRLATIAGELMLSGAMTLVARLSR
jgi:hypothetical protein